MARNLEKLGEHGGRSDFQDRVRLSITAAALKVLDAGVDHDPGGPEAARAEFALMVLRGDIGVHLVAHAVLAALSDTLPERPAGDPAGPYPITDVMIEEAMRPGGDLATGVFGKLALAHVAPPPEPTPVVDHR